MTRTVGIEEEFLVLGAADPAPRAVGEHVVQEAADGSDGQFEHELMQEQVELGTDPHTSLTDLRAELVRRRTELSDAARAHGSRLAALGTSPHPADPRLTPDARYERMRDTFGQVAATQLSCGMHVHVAVDSPEEGVAVLRRIRPWLPLLLALTTNSPLWDGADTAYASYRSVLWGQWPTAGLVPGPASPAEYDRLLEDLVTTGAAGDEGMIYFDARLSRRYPTLEVRICDVTPYADDAVTVAALLRALVETLAALDADPLCADMVAPQLFTAASWRAARWGMADELVDLRDGVRRVPAWDLADDLIATVCAALEESGDDAVVREGLDRIRTRGTGADLQRRVLRESDSVAAVVTAVSEATTGP